ncbi:unnamed protein product [Diatraea saccharalis]|uniref:Uncharacterized protein n=1 Tax=Diatraea saccharalis TaxID=40085 RepID=A0A9N9QWX3_9NEOP|nr:unnamed protein product [Diatraea saccharalis]
MKLLVILSLAALAVAAPQRGQQAEVLRYESDNIGLGGYRYAFETSDGTKHESQGEIRNEGREDEYLAVNGVYSWIAPNGVRYTVKYVADDNGYQPEIEEAPGAPGPIVASLLG